MNYLISQTRIVNTSCLIVGLVLLLSACKSDPPPVPKPGPTLSSSISLIHDEFQGVPIILAGSGGQNLVVSFERKLEDGTELEFMLSASALPIIMESTDGTKWDVFGEAVEGPLAGKRLKSLQSYMGYWFSFGASFPGVEIYEDTRDIPNIDRPEPSPNWLIAVSEVFSGAGKDGIPAIDNPKLQNFKERDYLDNPYYLEDDDLVIGIKVGNTYRAYPHAILNWHEIANDTIADRAFSIIYCPLTGTGMAWDRVIDGEPTTFGVSGLLYNNNIIPYDRATDSHWSQMLGKCVTGSRIGREPESISVVETTWRTWRDMFLFPQIMSPETGVARDYSDYPYGNYRTDHDFIAFPITYDDQRLDRKERVHGVIINGDAKVYRLTDF